MTRRALAGGLVAVALVVGLVWGTMRAGEPPRLVLAESAGDVRVVHGGDAAVSVATGQVLGADDALRTGADGSAVLAFGPETRIRVGAVSTVRVEDISDDGVSLELEGGALRATVRPGGALRVGNRGRSVAASDAEIAVGVGADDLLYAEVIEGELTSSGFGGPTIVAGQRVVVRANGEADVGPIPESLLLAVAWPEVARTRADTARVSGTSEPGARVTVQGGASVVVTVAGPDGRFEAVVPLAEGDNPLRVGARGVLGAETDVAVVSITRDTQVPIRATVEVGGPR